jgi:hypothetical protein
MGWFLPCAKGFMSDVAGRSAGDQLSTEMSLCPHTPDEKQESLGSLSVVRPIVNNHYCKHLLGELEILILPAKVDITFAH